MKLKSISDVAAFQQCCGCGACVWARPDTYEMRDIESHGLRPVVKSGVVEQSADAAALSVCPGLGLEHPSNEDPDGMISELFPAWGPVLEVWEGYAADPDIRFRSSSGGAATALSLQQIEQGGAHGVLHIKAKQNAPHLNETTLSTTRQNVLDALGSRYSPASPCEGLQQIVDAPGPCVFVGKPCDVAATEKAAGLSPELRKNLSLTIAIFCAGTPSTSGTLALLERMGFHGATGLEEFRYRGHGWPGTAMGRKRSDSTQAQLSYEESWGEILTKHVQWRCRVCADHTGEFADISVGDPWYRQDREGDPGRSLIVVRTARGLEALERAIEQGYLWCERADPALLAASQPNLLKARGAVAGRIALLRVLLLPAPVYRGLCMWRFWWSELGPIAKVRSISGTMKRVIKKRLYRRLAIVDIPDKAEAERLGP